MRTYDTSSPHAELGMHCPAVNYTGKERDSETASSPGAYDDLDDFGARYYSSRFGRFVASCRPILQVVTGWTLKLSTGTFTSATTRSV